MDLTDLREALGPAQPGYRALQIYEAIYRKQATDLVQISTLPARLREDLAQHHAVGLPAAANPNARRLPMPRPAPVMRTLFP